MCALLGHLLLYYRLVLRQRLLNLVVRLLALLDLQLALVFQHIYLRKQHLPTRLFLLVHFVGLQCCLDLLLNLQELGLPLLHHALGQLLVIVLEFSDGLALLNVAINLPFVGLFKCVSK